MSNDEILKLALKAGFKEGDLALFPGLLLKFAELIAERNRKPVRWCDHEPAARHD